MEDRGSIQVTSSILHPPSMRLRRNVVAFIRAARVAHLATADAKNQPLVIPICFAFDGKEFFSPIDEKPKQTAARRLRRLQNIDENCQVSLVMDRYNENWQRLAYVIVRGTAKVLLRGKRHATGVQLLRRKYRQYCSMTIDERPMIVITPKHFKVWGSI
jgi:PPOX class probable F420-dependent enzyme